MKTMTCYTSPEKITELIQLICPDTKGEH